MATGTQPAGGQYIANYRIIRRLGAGGMGEVFQAVDTRLNREVALKFLSPHLNDSESRRTSLINEARAASMLDHPNVGTIFGLEVNEPDQLFIVMAYYDGPTLAQRLRQGVLNNREAAEIALQVAAGLEAAHARNLIHRDVKPSNIIITKPGLVKLVDFGIAKAIHSENSTRTMGLSGTFAYLSPEHAEGKALDGRCDLWSLGAVLFEMLTGQPAFQRDNDLSTLYAIVHSPVPNLQNTIAPALQRVVYRALAKNAADRYQTAGEMMQDLRAFLETGTATGHQSTLLSQLNRYRLLASPPQTPKLVRPWVLALAAAVIVALVASLIFFRVRFSPDFPAHVAALPIVTSPEEQSVAEVLMEAIVSRLSNFQESNPRLWIVPTSEVRRSRVTLPAEAQKTLGANLVITGTLQHANDSLHLMLNVIDTSNPGKLRQVGSGDFTSREADLSMLEAQAVTRIAALMHLTSPVSSTGRTQTSLAYDSYGKATGYLQRFDRLENIDKAIVLLQGAVQADPSFPLAHSSLAQAYLAKNSRTKDRVFLAQAEQEASSALALDKDLAAAHVAMGKVQHELGHDDLALEEFQTVSKTEPRNADALFGLADVYQSQGRNTEAEDMLRRATALRPDYWEGHNRLGIFFKKLSRFDEATSQFLRVIELTPDNASAYSNLGATLLDQGKVSEALPPLEKASQLAPAYAIYANLGILYTRQHNYEKAAQATRQALAMNDKDWRVWSSLAIIYRFLHKGKEATGAYSRALPLLTQSIQLQSADGNTRAEYAELMAFTGQQYKANQQLDAALALAPGDPSVLMSGAAIYGASGDRAKAVSFANRAVSNGLSLAQFENDPESLWLKNDPQFHQPRK